MMGPSENVILTLSIAKGKDLQFQRFRLAHKPSTQTKAVILSAAKDLRCQRFRLARNPSTQDKSVILSAAKDLRFAQSRAEGASESSLSSGAQRRTCGVSDVRYGNNKCRGAPFKPSVGLSGIAMTAISRTTFVILSGARSAQSKDLRFAQSRAEGASENSLSS